MIALAIILWWLCGSLSFAWLLKQDSPYLSRRDRLVAGFAGFGGPVLLIVVLGITVLGSLLRWDSPWWDE